MVKFINELVKKHNGEDIYVIGSGKSLDFIDINFFDNKITIGTNQVYKKIKTTYLVRKDSTLLSEVIKNNDDTIHIISVGVNGSNNEENFNFIKKNYNDKNNIYLFNHFKNNHKLNNIPEDDNKLVVSFSTITTAIHLAKKLGAKNIIIVGHDCGLINGEENFKNYHTNESRAQENKNEYIEWLGKIENDTIFLKKYLKEKYNINVCSLNPFINFNLEGNIFKRS